MPPANTPDQPTPQKPGRPSQPGPPPLPRKNPKPRREPSAYEVVTDVALGPNIRVKDNLFQALFILASIAIAAGIGAFVAPEEIGPGWGAAMGAIVGLIAGALISGGFLMVYRLFKH